MTASKNFLLPFVAFYRGTFDVLICSNSFWKFAATISNLKRIYSICSNFILFVATFFNLQQLYFICSNFLICSMSLVGHRKFRLHKLLESLSNHDDDGNKNLQICIFDNEKQYFCTLCTCIFHLLTFWRRSRSFYDLTWNDLFCSRVDDVSIWWQMLIFVFFCPKC